MALTANNIRSMDLDEYQAYACKQLGLVVESVWCPSDYEEGIEWGNRMRYTLKW